MNLFWFVPGYESNVYEAGREEQDGNAEALRVVDGLVQELAGGRRR